MKYFNKAQAEIIGITIVMVLIMLGIIFIITFVIMPEDVNIKKVYDVEQLGSNFLDALLGTTACNDFIIRDVAKNCFENQENPTLQYQCPQLSGPGLPACAFLNTTVGLILSKSLDPINTQYEFFFCNWNTAERKCEDTITYFATADCMGADKEREEKQTIIPTDVGVRVARMVIC